METEATPQKRPKHRSPSYPAFDLGTALKRARELFEIAGKHGAPVPAALEKWGYAARSSNGSLTVAALKKFGLAINQGKRGARTIALTPLGHELVFYASRPESEDWKRRARKAALMPTIHADLWDKYNGELPTDSVITPYLVLELGFSEVAAGDLLRQFRRTIKFADLTAADRVDTLSESEDESDKSKAKSPPERETDMTPPATITGEKAEAGGTTPPKDGNSPASPTMAPTQRTIQIPYSRSRWALLQAEFPMTDAAWTQMLSVLEAMKPSLVDSDDD